MSLRKSAQKKPWFKQPYLKGVELSASYVEVAADGCHPEMVDPCLAQVGEYVGARLPVRLSD